MDLRNGLFTIYKLFTLDISSNGQISADEGEDFELFREHLSEMSLAFETLKLLVDKELA